MNGYGTERADDSNEPGSLSGQNAGHAVAVAAVQHRLRPLGWRAIRDLIEKPVDQVGVRVEQELVEQILFDVGPANRVLPLPSAALEQTWRRRRNGWLTLPGYANAGGLNGAIDRAAETAWKSLYGRHRDAAGRVMLRIPSCLSFSCAAATCWTYWGWGGSALP
jgi:hypothetical protein